MKTNQKMLLAACAITAFLATGSCRKRLDYTDQRIAEARQVQQESGDLDLRQGVLLLNNGRYDEAIAKLQDALRKNPNLEVAINALGIVYTYKRDFLKAIETFRRLLKVNPEFYDAYNSLGAIYMEMGDYDRAKQNLLTAANAQKYLTPDSAYANLAILEMRNNRYESAMRYVEKGLDLNNHNSTLVSLKGACLENQGKIDEALESYERAVTLTKNPSAQQLLALGRLYKQKGDRQKALDSLEQALSKTQDKELRAEINRWIRDTER